jgi:hypothetical protein
MSVAINQRPGQFADNLPFVQQVIIEHLHNWGLKVTPNKDGGMAFAFTITPDLPARVLCHT